MTEETLKNILVFLNRGAEAGIIKSTLDAMAFTAAHQTLNGLLNELSKPAAPAGEPA